MSKPHIVSLRRRAVRPREGLKQAILDAARRLCFAEGVDGISARKIARAIGCSATAIYSYYRNIDDVLHHLRMEGHALLAEEFNRVEGSLPPAERLREIGRAYYRFAVQHPKYYEVMFLSRFGDLSRREFVQREIFTLLILRDVVKEGMNARVFRDDVDPMVLANVIWSQMHGLASLTIAGSLLLTAPGNVGDLLEAVLDTIARGVLRAT